EAVKLLTQGLNDAGFKVEAEGLRTMWVPDEDAIEKCVDYGKNIAKIFA
ncbi:MAG TPA: anaerobic nitric oxide reductase flavorubredoxin, partial [Clostridiales bacterium]|nr:anaerobic nitric oxide reductase flavorubredoxin [Clostridiales bacterium]